MIEKLWPSSSPTRLPPPHPKPAFTAPCQASASSPSGPFPGRTHSSGPMPWTRPRRVSQLSPAIFAPDPAASSSNWRRLAVRPAAVANGISLAGSPRPCPPARESVGAGWRLNSPGQQSPKQNRGGHTVSGKVTRFNYLITKNSFRVANLIYNLHMPWWVIFPKTVAHRRCVPGKRACLTLRQKSSGINASTSLAIPPEPQPPWQNAGDDGCDETDHRLALYKNARSVKHEGLHETMAVVLTSFLGLLSRP